MVDPSLLYERILFETFGKQIPLNGAQLIAAGNMNQAVCLETAGGNYFLKTNHLEESDVFLKEKQGLELLQKNTSLHIPAIINWGRMEDTNYLLLEWIPAGPPKKRYWQKLADGLAELHIATQQSFGWDAANYISILPQNNTPTTNWETFYIQERLEPMLQRAYFHQLIDEGFMKKFRLLYPKIEGIFPKEKPALLHGDLWSGNVLVNASGSPSLIDPAVYFGHREMDIAFSKLFGGFAASFYETYQEVFPMEPGFEARKELYNLYPLLVHLNLFGTGYLAGIKRTISRYI
ncbi:fructosamine kinase family protein [Lunatibacter salilacus]|uniref:fructosamine kinase family protein n=1 Tax=Lunatibacter salilacus TaxID=2483804 RepID=UPI00131E191E|nr:fructosamine kinase family protein [Lunatibacter salilacus]